MEIGRETKTEAAGSTASRVTADVQREAKTFSYISVWFIAKTKMFVVLSNIIISIFQYAYAQWLPKYLRAYSYFARKNEFLSGSMFQIFALM